MLFLAQLDNRHLGRKIDISCTRNLRLLRVESGHKAISVPS